MVDIYSHYDCPTFAPVRKQYLLCSPPKIPFPMSHPSNHFPMTTPLPRRPLHPCHCRKPQTRPLQQIRTLSLNLKPDSISFPNRVPVDPGDLASATASNGKMDAYRCAEKNRREAPLPLNRTNSGSENVGVIFEGNDRDIIF